MGDLFYGLDRATIWGWVNVQKADTRRGKNQIAECPIFAVIKLTKLEQRFNQGEREINKWGEQL